jgi:hypothetical protein
MIKIKADSITQKQIRVGKIKKKSTDQSSYKMFENENKSFSNIFL